MPSEILSYHSIYGKQTSSVLRPQTLITVNGLATVMASLSVFNPSKSYHSDGSDVPSTGTTIPVPLPKYSHALPDSETPECSEHSEVL
jgi:hypothetical protein